MKLKRAAFVILAAVGLTVAAAGPGQAASGDINATWCWLAHWYSIYPTCNAYGDFYADGESFKLQDTRADGHSVVMRIWIDGDRKSDLWNKYGDGQYVYRDYALAEGTPVKFQLCIGEYSTKTVLDCQDKTWSGHA
ncbi:hypothetical protein [Cellulomonas alba]|uniref:Secreted protein n=1 Tax=Cellulomonas alba TaxID=3053467 RepID=A0ABT7SFT3_9CELL|nr:hypothetical protein [Cellulomonas alba]MDM7855052.1 hypothetical protein [Cellulomonas alba]